ncbi:WD40 repeat-like protein [Clavulina sp. PMI_390]|nr:WD40 repeat-like protein [Clavulina sp. PMI_390]
MSGLPGWPLPTQLSSSLPSSSSPIANPAASDLDNATHADHGSFFNTSYVPFTSPPTPVPSPSPRSSKVVRRQQSELSLLRDVRPHFSALSAEAKNSFLSDLLSSCPVETLVHICNLITPRIKRDFLRDLPPEIALHIVSFITDARTLSRASAVSKFWNSLLSDECLWRSMCKVHKYCSDRITGTRPSAMSQPKPVMWKTPTLPFSYKQHFKVSYLTEGNWRRAGRIVRSHTFGAGTVTNVSMDSEWIIVSLTNCMVYVFSAKTGQHVRNLAGHKQGIWALHLSDVCNASYGFGQEGAWALTGSCDRDLRVWDVRNGYCLHVLKGHTSTIRCVKAVDGRPVAVSASRDGVARVWDIQKGICLRVLEGHTESVRSLDVAGNICVTASYDTTARLWNLDTGECLRIFRGHQQQIYSVAFDGLRVATGSLDSTVRLWDAESGECLALFQGHTSLVGNVQILDDDLVTGGSDGRVIIFSVKNYSTRLRICAHDNSVTTLQVDAHYLVTGGNDGCVKLFDRATGAPVRELTERCDAVWKVLMRRDKCVIMCKRGGNTVVEILGFGPTPEQLCAT